MSLKHITVLVCFFVLLSGCLKGSEPPASTTVKPEPALNDSDVKTFRKTGDSICTVDGKPIVRLYSTTRCPHCVWIKETYDSVASEYMNAGKIAAHHWELDTKDDTLTENIETEVPAEERIIYQKYNPQGSVPTFVFGCRYVRVGNAYERANNLTAERQEFRNVIEALIRDTS
jgi:thiol-disulfide isomerase/thioredoxin